MKTEKEMKLLIAVVFVSVIIIDVYSMYRVINLPKSIRITSHHREVVADNSKLDSLQLVVDQLSKKQARLEREQRDIDKELNEIFD